MTRSLTRRQLLAGGATGLMLSSSLRGLLAAAGERQFRIGACDWSLGQRQQLRVLEMAGQIGLDGVEVSLDGGPSNDLRDQTVRQQYLAAARQHKVAICSLAMGVLNQAPYASDPRAEAWVAESIDVMVQLGVRAILLPFFVRGEIKGDDALQANVIRKLKRVAPKAERAGVVLGLETALDAASHRRILDAVGSPAVKVYYDVSNMLRRGYDIYREIPQLGDRICRFHLKERDCLLGQGTVDFPRVKQAIDAIGYRDWLVIESATVKTRSVIDCYRDNLKYVRHVFAPQADRAAKGDAT